MIKLSSIGKVYLHNPCLVLGKSSITRGYYLVGPLLLSLLGDFSGTKKKKEVTKQAIKYHKKGI